MNSFERKDLKRAKESLTLWKKKAIEREKEIRKLQITVRDLKQSRKTWKEKYESFVKSNSSPDDPSPSTTRENYFF